MRKHGGLGPLWQDTFEFLCYQAYFIASTQGFTEGYRATKYFV